MVLHFPRYFRADARFLRGRAISGEANVGERPEYQPKRESPADKPKTCRRA